MYGSSSKIVKSCSAASRSSSARFSALSVWPAGFWKLGMMCASFGFRRPSSSEPSAAVSIPSVSSSTMCSSA
jgi:hypothetical protein